MLRAAILPDLLDRVTCAYQGGAVGARIAGSDASIASLQAAGPVTSQHKAWRKTVSRKALPRKDAFEVRI
jgi:hypothetical protein